MKGIPYLHPFLYKLTMKILNLGHYKKKYNFLKKEIGDLTVLDVGCGDCELANYIKKENYSGWDTNEIFVKKAIKKGLNVENKDVRNSNFPKVDCIVFSEVLHHLQPDYKKIIKKAIDNSKKVIIIEPVSHVASSKNIILSFMGKAFNYNGQKDSVVIPIEKEELIKLGKEFNSKIIKTEGRLLLMVFENGRKRI